MGRRTVEPDPGDLVSIRLLCSAGEHGGKSTELSVLKASRKKLQNQGELLVWVSRHLAKDTASFLLGWQIPIFTLSAHRGGFHTGAG